MSTIAPLKSSDFPLVANGQYVYRQMHSGALIGPVSVDLARDLASRLNRDEDVTRALRTAAEHGEPLVLHDARSRLA